MIDASTAYRTAEGWAYGFAEMDADQRAVIAGATRVSNPGCYPTGFIGLVRPLTDGRRSCLRDLPLTVNAVSGYSGGGKDDDRRVRGSGRARLHAAFRIASTG